jgi:PilZ domain
MDEKRRAPRIKDENEVTITVVSGGKNLPEEEINGNHTKDISVCGAKIQTNILLPINTILELDITSKVVHQQIKILGKVKWSTVIIENESYESGVEFYPSKEMEKLDDYISWQLESNKSGFIKDKVPLIGSGNKNSVETKKVLLISTRHRQSHIGDKNILEIKKVLPISALLRQSHIGDKNSVDTKKISPIDPGNINIEETKKAPPIKNKRWIRIAITSLGTIILIVVLLKIFVSIPEFDRMLFPNIITKATPAPEAKKITVLEAITALEATPAPKTKQKTKVIGNSDSKKYHLPGMKYYNAVKASHRVEFDSETDAIRAGYNKAPR